MTFGRDRRVRRRSEFDRAFRDGRRVTVAHFVVVFAQRAEPGPSRLGLTVSRKSGNAVVRNRIKRLCRESFRRAPERLPEALGRQSGVNLVIIPRPGAEELDFDTVDRELEEALAKVRKLLAKPPSRGNPSASPRRSAE